MLRDREHGPLVSSFNATHPIVSFVHGPRLRPMRATVTSAGTLSLASQIYRAALGHGGIRRDRREGDGATPVGILPLRRVFYRADRIAAPKSVAPVTSLSPSDGWC